MFGGKVSLKRGNDTLAVRPSYTCLYVHTLYVLPSHWVLLVCVWWGMEGDVILQYGGSDYAMILRKVSEDLPTCQATWETKFWESLYGLTHYWTIPPTWSFESTSRRLIVVDITPSLSTLSSSTSSSIFPSEMDCKDTSEGRWGTGVFPLFSSSFSLWWT